MVADVKTLLWSGAAAQRCGSCGWEGGRVVKRGTLAEIDAPHALCPRCGHIPLEGPNFVAYTHGRIVAKAQRVVAERDRVSRKPVGRNDPCPCGSGRKFKKCCGATR